MGKILIGLGLSIAILGGLAGCVSMVSSGGSTDDPVAPISFFIGFIVAGIGYIIHTKATYEKEEKERLAREQKERATRRALGLPYIQNPKSTHYKYRYDVTVELPPLSPEEFFEKFYPHLSQFAEMVSLPSNYAKKLREIAGRDDRHHWGADIGRHTFTEKGKGNKPIDISAHLIGQSIVFHLTLDKTELVKPPRYSIVSQAEKDEIDKQIDEQLVETSKRAAEAFARFLRNARP